jgi:hypothetical protein
MFEIGTKWYTDLSFTTPYPTGSYATHNDSLGNDNTWVIIGSGSIVQSTGSCVTPTTTTTTTSTTTSTTTAPTTTTTSTTTSTTTLAYYTYRIYNSSSGYSSASDACTNQSFDSYVDYYAAESTLSTVTKFYSDTNLLTPFVGGDQWYAFTAGGTSTPVNRAQVNNGGFLSNNASC